MSVGGGGAFHSDWKKEKLAFCQAAGCFFFMFNLINLMTDGEKDSVHVYFVKQQGGVLVS